MSQSSKEAPSASGRGKSRSAWHGPDTTSTTKEGGEEKRRINSPQRNESMPLITRPPREGGTEWERIQLLTVTHRFDVLLEAGEAEVVDDVPGADQKRDAVALEQLEVVVVGLVAEEVLDRLCNEKETMTSYKVSVTQTPMSGMHSLK